jgi:hypothetical protein
MIQTKNILRIAVVVVLILLVPLLAMQFSGDFRWGVFDFALAGVLLFGVGLSYELVASRLGSLAYRAAVATALGGALMLVWVNIAVGIIGSEGNPANLMYIGVLAVLVIGALIARFRPQGMASPLLATAAAQAIVTVIALFMENFQGAVQIVLLNGFFIALWVGSAWLFRRAVGAPKRAV